MSPCRSQCFRICSSAAPCHGSSTGCFCALITQSNRSFTFRACSTANRNGVFTRCRGSCTDGNCVFFSRTGVDTGSNRITTSSSIVIIVACSRVVRVDRIEMNIVYFSRNRYNTIFRSYSNPISGLDCSKCSSLQCIIPCITGYYHRSHRIIRPNRRTDPKA